MDFKSLLQTMDNISETVHKAGPGGYGNRHGTETQTDQYGKPIGKVSLAKMGPKDDTPKKRGRPEDPDKPKTGKDDPKNKKVGDLFGRTTGDVPKGKKGSQHTPMKDADKEEKKAEKKSLKDWIEVSEHNQLNEEDVSVKPIQASQIIGADGKSMGTADPATANAIKAAAEKGTLNLSGDTGNSSSSSSSSSSTQPMTEKFDKPVKTNPAEKGKYEGKSKSELLKAYNHLKKTGPHEKGSNQYGNMKELAFAIRAKGDWGKVQETEEEHDPHAWMKDMKKVAADMQAKHPLPQKTQQAEKPKSAPHKPQPRKSDEEHKAGIDKQIAQSYSDHKPGQHIGDSYNPTKKMVEGEGDFETALSKLGGNWSYWHKVDSHNPGVDEYHFDDGEGGYYAKGNIEHNLETGQVTVDYSDEYDNDVQGTFDSFGEAMRALRGGGGNHGGKAPNFDNLGHREPYTSDDLYKSDRVGRKGSLSGGASNKLKQSIQFNKGRLGPKGVLPEQGISEADDDFEQEDEAYIACIVQHNRSGQAVVQRTKPISRDRAEEVIKHALSKNTFVHPPFMTIYPANAGKLDGSTIMAQFPDMSQEAGPGNTGMMESAKKKTMSRAAKGYDNEQLDEISQKLATKTYAKRDSEAFDKHDYATNADDSKDADKASAKAKKTYDRIGKRFGADAQKKADKAADKEIFGEEKNLPGKQDKLDVAPPKGKLTGADFKALSKKKKVKEGRTMQVLESINFKELMASADSEVQAMLIELQDDIEMFKETGHTSDLLDSFLKVHLHHNKNRITDEDAGAGRGYINPPLVNPSAPLPPARTASPGWGRDDYKPLTPDTSTGPAMGVNKGGTWTSSPTGTIRAPGGDPEGVKEGNFLSTLGQPNKTFESKNMKDIQLENWEKELNSLLTINEGITVSTSTGQQGSPDSVSVNATDGDSAELLQVLRQAGLGVFGGEEERSSYGSPMNSQEPTGAGSEPEMSPAVVGDGDDMMALIKKMSGIQDSGEPEGVAVVDVSSEEGDDEHSHYGSDNHDHEEHGDKEETDEGNAFGNEVRTKKADNIPDSQQRITTGGQNLPVKEEGHDHEEGGTCNECGMYEARCVCEPGHEQVEEDYANEAGHEEMAQLKHLLNVGNDMHKPKEHQSVGNPTKVTFETKLLKDSTSLLQDFQKLSGIK